MATRNSRILRNMNSWLCLLILFNCWFQLLDLSVGIIVDDASRRSFHPAEEESSEMAAAQYAHPSVLENSQREAELPPELSKSHRFLNNPKVAALLSKDSWFTEHEMPVYDREAEKIPREMIYKILKQSGLQ